MLSKHKVLTRSNSPPGFRPKPRLSRTAQAVQVCWVTRATAAKRIPVISVITCRIAGTALIRLIVAISAAALGLIEGVLGLSVLKDDSSEPAQWCTKIVRSDVQKKAAPLTFRARLWGVNLT